MKQYFIFNRYPPLALLLLAAWPVLSQTTVYVGMDTATQGNWVGKYGADGHIIASATNNVTPAYAVVTLPPAVFQWSGTSADPRALQQPATTQRIASAFYAPTSVIFDVNITDGQTHQVSFYLLDWDAGFRSEAINGITVSSFTQGKWATWNVSGHVTFTFTYLTGNNVAVSGIFFDPLPGQAKGPAVYNQGPAGPTGPPGPTGPTGPPGTPGTPGKAGPSGPQGVTGLQGPGGGQTGAQGVPGVSGAPGPAGSAGKQGVPGAPGSPGSPGPQGNQGVPGVTGPQGVPGVSGAPGPAGPVGPTGPTGTSGTTSAGGTSPANARGFLTGGSGALDCDTVPGVCDIVPAVVPFKESANIMTGVNRFSQLQVFLFTVATLPACNASFEGQMEGVTDAASPSYLQTVKPGGSVHTPVYCDGSTWVAY